jgi:hypothetical protein
MDLNSKFLYFQEGRTDSADSAIMYHTDKFLGFDTAASDGTLSVVNMRFLPARRGLRINQEDGNNVSDETDVITLTVKSKSEKSVIRNITDKMNEPWARTSRFLVIADDNEGEYVDSDITNCVITVRTATNDDAP